MIRLLIAGPGTGKTHWLKQQKAEILVECTNKSHRAILSAIADGLGIAYESRASIDDLISLILSAQTKKIALDDIDRAPAIRLPFSLMQLSTRHIIICTATEKKRIRPILERQAAIIENLPPVSIREIIEARYPDLKPAEIARIHQLANTPAQAINIAESLRNGLQIPPPPAHDWTPLLALALLSVVYLLRYQSSNPLAYAALVATGYVIRRWMWRKT